MARYEVFAKMSGDISIEIEAEDEHQALESAERIILAAEIEFVHSNITITNIDVQFSNKKEEEING